jgi:hypothetical protein
MSDPTEFKYANQLLVNLNELAFLEFAQASQTFNGSVAKIVVNYETLKQMHELIGNVLAQRDANLHELSRARSVMN